VETFAQQHQVPLIHFERRQRKDAVAAWYRERFQPAEGVVFIGIAQEKATSFKARKVTQSGHVSFDFSRQSVAVNHIYFYRAGSRVGAGVRQGGHLSALPGARLFERTPLGSTAPSPSGCGF
jgi:hypothetical protein